MKKHLLLIGALLLCFSCAKDEITDHPDDYSAGLSLDSRAPGLDRYNALGYGLDVTGTVDFANYIRSGVVDVDKFKAAYPTRIFEQGPAVQNGRYIVEKNSEEYASNINQKFNAKLSKPLLKKKLFSGEITQNYSKYQYTRTENAYASLEHYVLQRRYKIDMPYFLPDARFDNFLTDNFKEDLQNFPASEIVRRYGTHVLLGVDLGGKLIVRMEVTGRTDSLKRAASASLKANVSKIFSVSTSIDVNTSHANEIERGSLYYRTVGGRPNTSIIGATDINNALPAINISNWVESCDTTYTNMVLIDIPDNCLVPLYDLISDQSIKQNVQQYIEDYIKETEFSMIYYCYRYKNKATPDGRFFATNFNFNNGEKGNQWWTYADVPWIYPNPKVEHDGEIIPLYRYRRPSANYVWMPDKGNSFKTNSATGKISSFGTHTYNKQEIDGYVFTSQQPGTVPLYYLWIKYAAHYRYTINPIIYNEWKAFSGWTGLGILGYVYPPDHQF